LVFSFVCFVLACWQVTVPHHGRLIAAGLAFLVGAELFGGLAALQAGGAH
jgi:hypothetical protein